MSMKHGKISLWAVFSAMISFVILLDFLIWAFGGAYISDYIGGASSPIVISIADHISGMSSLAFYGTVSLVVVLLSVILALVIVRAIIGDSR